MPGLRHAVIQKAGSFRDYLISTTQELVKSPSVNHPPLGDEYACQMVVARHLQAMGLEAQAYYLDSLPGLKEHPSFFPGRDYSNRPNMVARRRGSGGGRSLLLSGHIDTVPLGLKAWNHDPFAGVIEAGKLFGLGACDMKAGIAINLCVLRILQELGVSLKGGLIMESVIDEEFGGVNGTLAGRLHGDNADAVIIPEPTGLVICNGNRGGLVAHITLEGPEGILFEENEPGHAVRELQHLLKWIDIYRQRRRAALPGWKPGLLDPIPMWVTKISAGGWGWEVPISVPGQANVELYMQLMPGETQVQVQGELFELMNEMVADKPNDFAGRPKVEFPIRFMPGSEIPADSPLILALNQCMSEVCGQDAEVRPLPAPSDLYLVHLDFNLPAVHLGPRGGGAHSADEYVVLEDLVTLTKTFTLLALDWCGVE